MSIKFKNISHLPRLVTRRYVRCITSSPKKINPNFFGFFQETIFFFAKAQVNLRFSFNIKIARKIGDSLLIAHQNTRLKLNSRWLHFTLGTLAFQIFHDDSMQETTLKSFVIFFFLIFHTSTFLLLLPRIGSNFARLSRFSNLLFSLLFLFSY